MENIIFIVNTLIGFALSVIIDIRSRDKNSSASPYNFNKSFYLKDNALRLILSILIMLAIFFNTDDVALIFKAEEFTVYNIFYLVVGFAPDYIIAYCKRKFGFLQPAQTEDYKRK